MVSLHPLIMDRLKEAKKKFIEQYSHLWLPVVPGGINGVGIGVADAHSYSVGITVRVESSQDVLDQIPNEYEGFPVHKKIVGEIVAL